MKITYDPSVDALYISFKDATVTTEHWTEGIAADFDAEGQLAGVEVLDASKVFGDLGTMKNLEFVEYPLSSTPRPD
ncbi:MAG TPA: DUF2283 domain-containing protein [Dehalococcoidia bacterium]|nr:DUF2283 domain-containing protein [Dehalococcoidia bacterium]